MRACLNAGLNTAKGLSLAWGIPLVGVHHMQAHALTPRLVHALSTPITSASTTPQRKPDFPFLTLLVSGGHTLLLHSQSLTSHPILANTADVALGDCIDKLARHILPEEILASAEGVMYGPLLESFAFPHVPLAHPSQLEHTPIPAAKTYNYTPPASRHAEISRADTVYGWAFTPPFAETKRGAPRDQTMQFSFTGVVSTAKRVAEARIAEGGFGVEERRLMAQEGMRVCFEHLAGRVILGLEGLRGGDACAGDATGGLGGVDTLVVSGGVAANGYLRAILHSFLSARGHPAISLTFPPLDLCTDNAAMIAWAGIEMFEAGWESELDCRSLNRWSLDPGAEDGGVLGVGGWRRR